MEITNRANGNVPVNGANMMDAAATGKAGRKTSDRETLAARKVAKEFETLFVGMMLKSMRETVGKDKLTDGGHGEEIYRSLLDQEYAKSMTENGGVGLSAMLERQLVKPTPDSALNQGNTNHDTTIQNAKTEVDYENR
jgi:peptidoglycan hydrolase FlgJ